jgi:hypothetical protein
MLFVDKIMDEASEVGKTLKLLFLIDIFFQKFCVIQLFEKCVSASTIMPFIIYFINFMYNVKSGVNIQPEFGFHFDV